MRGARAIVQPRNHPGEQCAVDPGGRELVPTDPDSHRLAAEGVRFDVAVFSSAASLQLVGDRMPRLALFSVFFPGFDVPQSEPISVCGDFNEVKRD